MISEDVSCALAGIDVPVLVLGADHDPIEPVNLLAEHVVARIAGAALEVISDSGHLIPLEQPRQVADRITAFVDRLPQPPHAFEELIVEDFVQHNPQVDNGRAAVQAFFAAAGAVDVEGKIVEHWDVLQAIPDTTASGNDHRPTPRPADRCPR